MGLMATILDSTAQDFQKQRLFTRQLLYTTPKCQGQGDCRGRYPKARDPSGKGGNNHTPMAAGQDLGSDLSTEANRVWQQKGKWSLWRLDNRRQ
jgi:hypothetical protein